MVKIWYTKFLSLLLVAIFAVGALFHTLNEHATAEKDYSYHETEHSFLHKFARHPGSCINEHKSTFISQQEDFCAICANLHSIAAPNELLYDEMAVFESSFQLNDIFPPPPLHLHRQRSRAPPVILA